MSDKSVPEDGRLFQRVREILENERYKVFRTANTEMLRAYWNVAREIVVEEQKGQDRDVYGSALLEEFAKMERSAFRIVLDPLLEIGVPGS